MLGVYMLVRASRYRWSSAHTLGFGAVAVGLLVGFVASGHSNASALTSGYHLAFSIGTGLVIASPGGRVRAAAAGGRAAATEAQPRLAALEPAYLDEAA